MKLYSKSAGLTLLLASIAAAKAMDMDMHMSSDEETDAASLTLASDVNISTIVPVAHEAMHMHGVPILETKLTTAERLYWENYNTTSYFTVESDSKSQLYIHIFTILGTFIFLYPIVLILNNLNSKWYLPMFYLHAIITLVSLFSYSLFIHSVPDLYPKNSYTRMLIVLFIMTLVQTFAATIHIASKWLNGTLSLASTHMPLSTANIGKSIPLDDFASGSHSPSSTLYDSHHSEEDDSVTAHQTPNDSFDLEMNDRPVNAHLLNNGEEFDFSDHFTQNKSKYSSKTDSLLSKISSNPIVEKLVLGFGTIFSIIFNFLNWGLFFYFLILLPTGIACLTLMGQGNKVFNLLAHFIKGGVFFGLGILSLARYSGAFEKLGWGWNVSYITKYEKANSIWYKIQPHTSMITMEMIESSLILFYGSTNVFLEHLANPGGKWAAKDLQHVSIAFMYFGAGLCGVITEVKLSSWRRQRAMSVLETDPSIKLSTLHSVTPGFSPNPFPTFTIFWTGLLMSQHAQASALSTQVHVQWGSLLTYGSFFRVFTFFLCLFTVVPESSTNSLSSRMLSVLKPSRPLTELITAFCLLCGGMVFMESTDQVIEALEYRGLTPMFTLNVSVGVIALIMAWIMTVFAIKDSIKAKMYPTMTN